MNPVNQLPVVQRGASLARFAVVCGGMSLALQPVPIVVAIRGGRYDVQGNIGLAIFSAIVLAIVGGLTAFVALVRSHRVPGSARDTATAAALMAGGSLVATVVVVVVTFLITNHSPWFPGVR